MNDFYVYEHIRQDNNTCFYVGKGRGNRAYNKTRNTHHDRIVEKYGMIVNIVADGLDEEEAYALEKERIEYYVFELGYGIDIIGFNNQEDESGHLTNHTFGGDGSYGMIHTEEWKKQHSIDMTGSKNPMYGINLWDSYTNEKASEIKSKISNASSGENNPMYKISPKERMDSETYLTWLDKTKNRLHSQIGDKNPNYKNTTLRDKLEANPELKMQYYSRPGGQNGRARTISVYDLEHNYLNTFSCIKDCALWMKDTQGVKAKIDSMRPWIVKAATEGTTYKKLHFKFEN